MAPAAPLLLSTLVVALLAGLLPLSSCSSGDTMTLQHSVDGRTFSLGGTIVGDLRTVSGRPPGAVWLWPCSSSNAWRGFVGQRSRVCMWPGQLQASTSHLSRCCPYAIPVWSPCPTMRSGFGVYAASSVVAACRQDSSVVLERMSLTDAELAHLRDAVEHDG